MAALRRPPRSGLLGYDRVLDPPSRIVRQLRLKLQQPVSYRRHDFVAGASNAAAREQLEAWPNWHGGVLALVGPEGTGKSHLAKVWVARAGAIEFDRGHLDLAAAAGRPVLVEDVDRGIEPEALFHLINMAAQPGGGLLLTARTTPSAWTASLPDLRSRLNAMPTAQLDAPDDVVLEGVLRKLFRERNIRAPKEVFPYLLFRMERSIPVAREIVRRLDETADHQQRPISRALARQILEDDTDNLDLFE